MSTMILTDDLSAWGSGIQTEPTAFTAVVSLDPESMNEALDADEQPLPVEERDAVLAEFTMF